MAYTLIMGNKVYSSWSLRGWMLLRPFGIAFEQKVVPLHSADFEAFRSEHFPARQVPTLVVAGAGIRQIIPDSMSIAEFVHECHPDVGIWPAHPEARAAARTLCAEMHSGFRALRMTMPMNLRRQYRSFVADAETAADIARIAELWAWSKSRWGAGGPFLFGSQFCAADAFFAPVAARFKTYATPLDELAQTYRDALLSHPAITEFYADAAKETWVLDHNEMDIA